MLKSVSGSGIVYEDDLVGLGSIRAFS